MPDALRALMGGRTMLVHSPESVRPWQHVLELVSGYSVLVEKLWTHGTAFDGGWNIWPEDVETRPIAVGCGTACSCVRK